MLCYVMVGSNDLARARRFYEPLMKLLGAVPHAEWTSDRNIFYTLGPNTPAFGVTGRPFDGKPATVGNGSMISFLAPTRAVVDRVHVKALELGGKDEGAPGIRGDDPNGFYGAYFRDLDGNKLCVCRLGPP